MPNPTGGSVATDRSVPGQEEDPSGESFSRRSREVRGFGGSSAERKLESGRFTRDDPGTRKRLRLPIDSGSLCFLFVFAGAQTKRCTQLWLLFVFAGAQTKRCTQLWLLFVFADAQTKRCTQLIYLANRARSSSKALRRSVARSFWPAGDNEWLGHDTSSNTRFKVTNSSEMMASTPLRNKDRISISSLMVQTCT